MIVKNISLVKNISFMTMFIILIALCSLFAFRTTAMAEAQYKIAVVVPDTTDAFWKMAEKGLNDMAAKYSDVEATYYGSQHYNVEQFLNTLQLVIASQPDAVVCPLIDPMYMDEILRPAIAEGLLVIAIHDTDLREPAESRIPVLAYIGEDSYTFGKIAAQETLKRFTPKQAIFCNHAMGTEKIDALGRGWVETMQAEGITAEQLNVAASGGGLGTELVAAYVYSHPDTDTIFAADFSRMLAFILRLEADGYQIGQEINIIQLGSEPMVLDFLKQGKITFTMDQQPYIQAYLGAMLAYVHLKYEFTPAQKAYFTDPVLITQDNIAEPPGFTVPSSLLENLRSEGIPDNILQDLQSLEEK